MTGDVIVTEQSDTVISEKETVSVLLSEVQGPPGAKGEKGDPGVAGSVSFLYQASTPMSGHKIVMLDGYGKLAYASSYNLEHAQRVIGITTNAASIEGDVSVLSVGEITEPSWNWQPNIPIYLGLDGSLTQEQPSMPGSKFSMVVGFPITDTTMFLNIGYPIILS